MKEEANGPINGNHWIIPFGCDPRYRRAAVESTKWWGWATDSELKLARQGVTGLTLRFFIDFLKSSLKGTLKEDQFALRSSFLMALLDSGKILDSRLVLNRSAFNGLPSKYRQSLYVAQLVGSSDLTSMICLKCANDVYIIEGTHSFGLRMFHKNFPVWGFWENPGGRYNDKELRISPSQCPVFLRHDPSGKWVNNFFYQLRARFHIEWDGVHVGRP